MSETSRRREILDAARRCFARDGYHATSIKAIAREADIKSPSILHYHFKSKNEIFLAVMRDALGTLTERATETGLKAQDTPRGLGAIDAFFTLLDREKDLAPLLVECMAMGLRGEAAREELSELIEGLEDLVRKAILRLLGSAADRMPLEPGALAASVLDILLGHVLRSGLRRGDERVAHERRGILALLALIRPAAEAGSHGSFAALGARDNASEGDPL